MKASIILASLLSVAIAGPVALSGDQPTSTLTLRDTAQLCGSRGMKPCPVGLECNFDANDPADADAPGVCAAPKPKPSGTLTICGGSAKIQCTVSLEKCVLDKTCVALGWTDCPGTCEL